jgi:hypothetical protein
METQHNEPKQKEVKEKKPKVVKEKKKREIIKNKIVPILPKDVTTENKVIKKPIKMRKKKEVNCKVCMKKHITTSLCKHVCGFCHVYGHSVDNCNKMIVGFETELSNLGFKTDADEKVIEIIDDDKKVIHKTVKVKVLINNLN